MVYKDILVPAEHSILIWFPLVFLVGNDAGNSFIITGTTGYTVTFEDRWTLHLFHNYVRALIGLLHSAILSALTGKPNLKFENIFPSSVLVECKTKADKIADAEHNIVIDIEIANDIIG